MKKSNLIGACAFVVVLFPTMVIALNLSNLRSSSRQEPSQINLVVYQIGLSHVTMKIPVEFVDFRATITLPSSAIPQTLRITGVDIKSMKLRQKVPQQLLIKGDVIVVHTQSETYEGTYEGVQEGYLVINQEGRSTLISLSSITAIEVSRAVATATQENGITLEIDAEISGSYTINVSFLSRATSWSPSHFLDLEEGKIQTWAMIASSENWTGATLTLIVGQPHIVFEGPIYANNEGIFSAKSNEFRVTNLEEYYAYKYERPFLISSGETTMIPLLSGTLGIEKEYFWAGDYYSSSSTPVEYVNITNTLEEPIPEGPIQFYRGNEWIGNDRIPYVAVNSTVKLMVAYAHDLKVEQKMIKIEHLSGIDKITIQVKATNYKAERASITIKQTIPYKATLDVADPKPKQEGQILTWTVSLDPGESKFITYTYSMPVERSY
ncbi:MAG: hypothetical protein ACUVTL_00065 [Thermoproteota archaeon]